MKYPLCEQAINKTTSIRVDVKCALTGEPCKMIRWCTQQRTVKMNELYKKFGCAEKNKPRK